jgi:hypothetical protein
MLDLRFSHRWLLRVFVGCYRPEKVLILKDGVFWDVTLCGSCKNRRFGGCSASFIGATRIGELGTTLAVTSNRRTLRRNTNTHLKWDIVSEWLPTLVALLYYPNMHLDGLGKATENSVQV